MRTSYDALCAGTTQYYRSFKVVWNHFERVFLLGNSLPKKSIPCNMTLRYITAEQKKTEEFAITEDDVSEIRQDINKFRYEMIEILRNNNFNTPEIHRQVME